MDINPGLNDDSWEIHRRIPNESPEDKNDPERPHKHARAFVNYCKGQGDTVRYKRHDDGTWTVKIKKHD
jgi:hypothetical protein